MSEANAHGQASELHVKTTGPSGWETPENVEKMIAEIPPAIERMLAASKATEQASIAAARAMHQRVTWLAGLICFGAIVAVLVDLVAHGRTELAERVLIPLISFAGGFGLGTRLGK